MWHQCRKISEKKTLKFTTCLLISAPHVVKNYDISSVSHTQNQTHNILLHLTMVPLLQCCSVTHIKDDVKLYNKHQEKGE